MSCSRYAPTATPKLASNRDSILTRSLQRPILCLVVDRSCSTLPVMDAVEAAVAAGVDWLQIRERSLAAAPLLAFAREIERAARRGSGGREICLIVNRRVDVALALGTPGVHLGFDGLSAARANALLGPDALVGCSAHAPEEVKAAADAGAHYAQLAPIFAPVSKPATRPALGPQAVSEAAKHGIAVLAQGGIEALRCAELLKAGAAGIAVTGAILMTKHPGAAAASLRAALDA